jgi:hypothetical protein
MELRLTAGPASAVRDSAVRSNSVSSANVIVLLHVDPSNQTTLRAEKHEGAMARRHIGQHPDASLSKYVMSAYKLGIAMQSGILSVYMQTS